MCGILANINFSGQINPNIKQATSFLKKRGPDYIGELVFDLYEKSIVLIHTRLSIIDLSDAANQPFVSSDSKWNLIFNGEIYNYQSIKNELIHLGYKFRTNSDTEVLVNAFDKWGINCLNKLIGMFAFVICNRQTSEIFVVRDRTGVKPLYYEINNSEFNISSDLNSLMNLSKKDKSDVNYEIIPIFLKYGYLSNSHSFVNGITKLEQGSYIYYNLKNNVFKKEKYWDPINIFSNSGFTNDSVENITEKLENLLISACEYRMVSDVPVGVFLSGGFDSSAVAALLSKKGKYNISTYSIGFQNPRYDESIYAKDIAKHLGVKHNEYICTEDDAINIVPQLVDVYDEPFGDSSAIPTLLVSRFASYDVKVVLSADGGDELFGGYTKYTSSDINYRRKSLIPNFLLAALDKVPNSIIIKLISHLNKRKLDETHLYKFKALLKAKNLLEFNDIMGSQNYSQLYNLNNESDLSFLNNTRYSGLINCGTLNPMLLYDYEVYLEADILKKVDRATMYYSIEGREPLLDHRLFEYLAKIPENLKIQNGIQKYLLKEIVYKYLPKKLMDRPKKGFSLPIHEWCHKDDKLKQLFFDTLSSKSLNNLPILNFKELEKLKNKYLSDGNSHFNVLWYLFNYIRWFEKYFI